MEYLFKERVLLGILTMTTPKLSVQGLMPCVEKFH